MKSGELILAQRMSIWLLVNGTLRTSNALNK